MDNRYTIQNELQELNSHLPFPAKQPYAVPDGYFENLASIILSTIKEDTASDELERLSPLLASVSRKMPFSVPDHYFEHLELNLPENSREDSLPAIFNNISRATPYQVPEDYFDKLPAEVLAKVAKPQAKVVSFNRSRWMRYASAAIIGGAIALGSIAYFSNTGKKVDPVKQPYEWVAKKLQNVSNQELEEFIKTAEPVAAQQQVAQNTTSGKEVRKLLKDVSTKELDAFLSSVPLESEETSTIN